MKQNAEEIADLAESIGLKYLSHGKVAINRIAKNNDIEIIYGGYEDYFDGLLCRENLKYYMHINTDKVPNIKSERTRFTIAHELGHFFIDKHRKKLESGTSLSFHGNMTEEEKQIEQEANHFASNLLMPKTVFCKLAKQKEQGLEAILALKKIFNVSIYASSIHYLRQNLSCSIMIKWNSDYSYHFALYSNSFSSLTGVKKKPPIIYPINHFQKISEIINTKSLDYFEDSTCLSKWLSTIAPMDKKDVLGVEQTIKLGEFGGITILSFN